MKQHPTPTWRKLKGDAREVFRYCEWFRAYLDDRCTASRGTARDLSVSIGRTEGYMSYLRSGRRTPDLKVACQVAHYFKVDLITLLETGRRIAEPEYPAKAAPASHLLDARGRLEHLYRSDRKAFAVVDHLLRSLDAEARAA
jgi:transcriptional regulator with XRE-family HTH domain